mgnify:CR=1 FL=1
MLVREISVLVVDVVVLVYLMERLEQRALAHAQLARSNFPAPRHVVPVENAHGDGQRVFVLEFAVIFQEREAGMCLEQLLDERLEVLADNGVRSRRLDEAKESLDVVVRLHLVAPEREEIIQGDALTRPGGVAPPTQKHAPEERCVEERGHSANLGSDRHELILA